MVVTPVFTANAYTLTVNTATGGSASKVPDTPSYAYEAQVQLTATARPGYRFNGWTGDYTGTDNPATVTITKNMVVTPVFTANAYTLTVNTATGGSASKVPD